MDLAIKTFHHMKEKARTVKKSTWIITAIFVGIMIASAIYALGHMDMKEILTSMNELPILLKYMVMIALISLQIFMAFLPGEPLELASGYLFGAWQGTLICLIGSCLGTAIVYFIVKVFKRSVIDLLFDEKKVNEVSGLFASKKGMIWTFVLFLIPGSPKDIMTYLVSLGNIKLFQWLMLTTIGRIPSIVTSTFLSGSLKEGNIIGAIFVAMITILLVVGGTLFYKKMVKTNEKVQEIL